MALSPKRQRFCEEYLVDLNGAQAAIRAGYSEATARQIASELLSIPDVQEYIAELRREQGIRTGITADAVLERWWELANADAGELTAHRLLACRYCHGVDHEFQWIDENEYLAALSRSQKESEDGSAAPVPSDSGGYGYKRTADVHPGCPKCEGEGVPDVWIADTRKLSDGAAALFDGVKQTQNGLEIKVRDRDAALLNVAKHLGMMVTKVEHDVSDNLTDRINAGRARSTQQDGED